MVTRAFDAGLARQLRRAEAFVFNMKNTLLPDRFQSDIRPGVSTYRVIHICGTTCSVPGGGGGAWIAPASGLLIKPRFWMSVSESVKTKLSALR